MKGITPVIAIVLLLLLTIAAAGAAFIWISSVQDTIASSSQTSLSRDMQCINSRISIDNIRNETSGSDNTLYVTIRNRGAQTITQNDMEYITFYVDGVPVDFDTSGSALNSLGAGEFREMTLCDGTTCSGNTYDYPTSQTDGQWDEIEVKIEPPCGTGDSESYQHTD